MTTLIIIARPDVWAAAQKSGFYSQSTVASTLEEVGFIHSSFPDQTLEIANRRFKDEDNLILLLVDTKKVEAPIKYEGALSGRAGTFPHIYGPLNVDAVYDVVSLSKNEQGEFIAPERFMQLSKEN